MIWGGFAVGKFADQTMRLNGFSVSVREAVSLFILA
jgi:hypothetical protein